MKFYNWVGKVVKANSTFTVPIAQGSISMQKNNSASTTQLMIRPSDYNKNSGIAMGDIIYLYYQKDSDVSYTENLFKPFFVRDVTLVSALNTYYYTVTCVDYTSLVLSFLGSKINTSRTFIEHMRVYITDMNNSNRQSNIPLLKLSEDVPTVNSQGLLFPDVEYYATQKALNTIFDELCSSSYTGDGKYDWYIDKYNYVHVYKSSTYSGIDLSGVTIKDFKYSKGSNQVVNMLIVYAGKDLNGNAIYCYKANIQSISKYGLHSKLEVKQSFREDEYKLHPTATNEQFRGYVLERANNYADGIVNQGYAYSINTVELNTYACVVEPYNKVILPSFIRPSVDMYVKQVTHTLNTSGWNTKLTITDLRGMNNAN